MRIFLCVEALVDVQIFKKEGNKLIGKSDKKLSMNNLNL